MFATIIFTQASLEASQVHVTIDGRQVNFTDQGPTIVDDRTLVPVRGVFEELGFEVDWEQDTQTARLIRNGHEVTLTIGSATFITNGGSHTLDVPAQIIGGRTMLPIRAVLESVGYSVEWLQDTSTVSISSSGRQATNENENKFGFSNGINENGFWEGIRALDYVEMFDYNNLEIPWTIHGWYDNDEEYIYEMLYSLAGFQVNEGQLALTDEIVFENLSPFMYGVTTAAEVYELFGATTLGEAIKASVNSFLTEMQRSSIELFVEDYIFNEVNVSSIPKELMQHVEQILIQYQERNTFGPFQRIGPFSHIRMHMTAEEMARGDLVLQAVAEHGGFSVSKEEIEDFFEEKLGTRDYSSYVDIEEYGLPYITKVLLHQKIFDHIVENALLKTAEIIIYDDRLQTAEANHRIIVSATAMFIATNNGAVPPNAAALDVFMSPTFAELNGSGPQSAQPTGAQYTFTSATYADGGASIRITTTLDGQTVATWEL